MDLQLTNLFGVILVAFAVPFVLGFFPAMRVPSAAVELLIGILIGPALLDWVEPGLVVSTMSSLGVAFLLFLAGMELDLRQLRGPPLRLGALGFLAALAIAFALALPLGANGIILSPLLVTIALCATSVGIVVPVLRDTGQLESTVGRFTLAGGSFAEVGTIALLGVFFAGDGTHATVAALLFAIVAVCTVLLFVTLRTAARWELGQRIVDRLDDTSAQMRVRFAMLILIGAAMLASSFGFEAILGTFLAGAVFGIAIRDDRYEARLRTKLEGIGFGFFVPVFFVTSGLRFDLAQLAHPADLLRVLLFLAMLLAVRALPAILYRGHLSGRQVIAVGLLQAANLSFIVVAVSVGTELGRLQDMNATALITAGLISAVLFPALAQWLLSDGDPLHGQRHPRASLSERL